jgi:hypothetical protein
MDNYESDTDIAAFSGKKCLHELLGTQRTARQGDAAGVLHAAVLRWTGPLAYVFRWPCVSRYLFGRSLRTVAILAIMVMHSVCRVCS